MLNFQIAQSIPMKLEAKASLTNYLTLNGTILIKKLIISELVKKFPVFYATRLFIFAFTMTTSCS